VDGAVRLHVVVIDDDQAILGLLRDVLESEGYRVTALLEPPPDPADLAALAPDLLVVDLLFRDGVDGPAFLRALKHHPATGAAPLLVCSAAHHIVVEMADDLERWCCAVVPKPFDLDVLLAGVRRCLEPAGRDEAVG